MMCRDVSCSLFFFFFQAEDGIRDIGVTRVQTCALPIFFQNLTGLYEDVAARGGMLRSKVRQLERVPAPIPVAVELGLREEDSVIVLDRLRFVNGVPWVVVATYLPYELCPQLLQEDMEDQSDRKSVV